MQSPVDQLVTPPQKVLLSASQSGSYVGWIVIHRLLSIRALVDYNPPYIGAGKALQEQCQTGGKPKILLFCEGFQVVKEELRRLVVWQAKQPTKLRTQ